MMFLANFGKLGTGYVQPAGLPRRTVTGAGRSGRHPAQQHPQSRSLGLGLRGLGV